MVVNGFVFLAGLAAFTGVCMYIGKGPKPGADTETVRKFNAASWIVAALILVSMVAFLGQAGLIGVGSLALGALIGLAMNSARRKT
jgi:hypothetical protein